jgi:phosphoglycolate phosphatase-like HAD superfamily hydrolase
MGSDRSASIVLFDIDGTLVRTGPVPRRAFRASLREVFGTVGVIDGHEFGGKTDPQIAREVLAGTGISETAIEDGVDRLLRRYVRLLQDGLRDPGARPVPLPGVPELLDAVGLETRCAAGLLTGNVEEGARLKLEAAGLAEHFSFGAYGSDSAHRPDLPAVAVARARALGIRVEGVVVVGDTPRDVECGALSGARTVAVATGDYGEAELRSAGASVVLSDLTDTRAAVHAILG